MSYYTQRAAFNNAQYAYDNASEDELPEWLDGASEEEIEYYYNNDEGEYPDPSDSYDYSA